MNDYCCYRCCDRHYAPSVSPFSRDQIVLVMIAVDADKKRRIESALEFNRDGSKALSDNAWREAAELDVVWNRLARMRDDFDK